MRDDVESGDLNDAGLISASLACGSFKSCTIGFEFAEAGLIGSSECSSDDVDFDGLVDAGLASTGLTLT